YALSTSAKGTWGAVVPPALPLYGAVGVGVVLAATRAWCAPGGGPGRPTRRPSPLVPVAAFALLAVPLLGVHTLHSFRDPAPWQAGTGITHGPNAGLLATAQG